VSNTPRVIGFGYPVGWVICCVIELTYFFIKWGRRSKNVLH